MPSFVPVFSPLALTCGEEERGGTFVIYRSKIRPDREGEEEWAGPCGLPISSPYLKGDPEERGGGGRGSCLVSASCSSVTFGRGEKGGGKEEESSG